MIAILDTIGPSYEVVYKILHLLFPHTFDWYYYDQFGELHDMALFKIQDFDEVKMLFEQKSNSPFPINYRLTEYDKHMQSDVWR